MKPNIWVTKKSAVSLSNKITTDFGKKCEVVEWYCAKCQAHKAVDLLEGLYDKLKEGK